MKFFKWRIETKIERLDLDDKIIFLAEELLSALEKKPNYVRDAMDYINVRKHDNFNIAIQASVKDGYVEVGGEYIRPTK